MQEMIASIGRLEGRGSFRDTDGSITGVLNTLKHLSCHSSGAFNTNEQMTMLEYAEVVRCAVMVYSNYLHAWHQ
jgi:hypothetical protein